MLTTPAFDMLLFDGVTYRASGELQMFAPLVATGPGGSVWLLILTGFAAVGVANKTWRSRRR